VEAEGRVRMIAGIRTAMAEKAVYYREAEKIVLTGSPRVWENDNMVSGKTITVFLEEERSVVEESVKAVFYPGKARTAVASPSPKPREEDPLVVTSARMEADHQNRQIVFLGDVVVKRGGMTLYADRVTLYYR